MKIGAQLYTVRDFTKTEEDVRSTFRKIAKMGYSCVQISAIWNVEPKKLREIADENGLEIVITHADKDRILNDTLAVIEEHKVMGCKHIGIGYNRFQADQIESYANFIQEYDQAAKLIHKNGLKLHYHNHAFEFEKVGDITGFEYFVKETDPALWGFILDTFWVQYGGKNPADVINALDGRITAIHYKDFAMKDDKQKMSEILEGNLDWTKIVDATEKTKIEYVLIEQDGDWAVGPFESLETSFNNLTRFLSKR